MLGDRHASRRVPVTVANGTPLPTGVQVTYSMVVKSADANAHVGTLSRTYSVGPPASLTGKLVFTRGNRIWVINPDGTGLSQLTGVAGRDPGTAFDDQAAKSPDGQKVVSRRATASAAALWVVDADGRNPVQLTSAWPTSAPTVAGRHQIAFGWTCTGSKGIWPPVKRRSAAASSTPPPGGSPVPVDRNAGHAFVVALHATGKIAFASTRNQSQFLRDLLHAGDLADAERQCTNDPHTDREPSWSPDGTKITFSSDRAGGSGAFEIYTMGPTGNSQQRLTSLSGDDRAPYVLADGDRVRVDGAPGARHPPQPIREFDEGREHRRRRREPGLASQGVVLADDDAVERRRYGDPMALLAARGITKSFGSRLILDGLDLDVEPGVRMGIIGPNGGGKSTLLRIVTGEETSDAGDVTQRRGLVLAFLPQQLEGDDRDPLHTLRAARPDLDELETELAKVESSSAMWAPISRA